MDDNSGPAHRHDISFSDGSSTAVTLLRTGDDTAPLIMCLPAMGVAARYYERLADALTGAGFHVALADHRGNATSSVRASRRVSFGYAEMLELELPAIIEDLCARFGVDRLIVVGHSLGGQMGLLLAATSPRVSHVVAIASGSAWYRRVPGLRSAGRFLGLQLMFAVTLIWGYLPTWFPFAGREARRLMLDWGFEAMTGRYRISGSRIDYERALAESVTPALFVTFPDDSYVPAACSAHLAAKLGSAQVTWREITPADLRLPRTHHFRWALRPTAVAHAVAEWIDVIG